MTKPAADPLLARIVADCKLSTAAGGHMPIRIIVRDDAEKARGIELLKGRHGNQAIAFATEAEIAAGIKSQLRLWRRALVPPAPAGQPSDDGQRRGRHHA